jgi:thiol:disulfide interchange protein/DsbC/DsbD-like thiol-disulfide interchange protein
MRINCKPMNFLSLFRQLVLGLVWAAGPLSAQAQTALQAALSGSVTHSAVVRTDQVQAELLVHAPQGFRAGQPVWLGLQLTHQPDWHTYWKNPGDSGLPTRLEWALPAGLQAGDMAWPAPKKFPLGSLANYGYEGTVLLPVPVTVAANFSADQVAIKLKASWLACRRECIPQEGEFVLQVPAGGALTMHAAAFQAALAAQPRDIKGAGSLATVEGQTLKFVVQGLPATARGQELAFFPEDAGIIEPGAAWTQAWQGLGWTAELPLSALRSQAPAAMTVVLTGAGSAWRLQTPVSGTWPAVAPLPGVSPALEAALQANANAQAPSSVGWLAALLGALLGGLLLNLMPCVFPVLAIKMLGFVKTQERRVRVQSGMAYTAGALLSFVALGGLLLALRAAGEQLGWGFQLQNPGVVAALAALFTLIGLNLTGVFEVGHLLPSRLASLEARHPAADAFLSGVLAVAVASPCTAPFMGASLGLALALPTWQALAVFAALGLGMALPYLAASLAPGVARWMPRPGVWMLRLKQALAFPMFATVVWLVWVLGQQSGMDGAAALLVLLLLLALLMWTLSLTGRSRTLGAGLSVLACAWALSWALPLLHAAPLAAAPSTPAGEPWQAWSPDRMQELQAQGRPVLVDFTAAWCVTCQFNKKNALQDEGVLADARARQVVLLRADWTRRDPQVTAALRALGRSGVPVYALYAPGKPPVLLSEILSARELRQALAQL